MFTLTNLFRGTSRSKSAQPRKAHLQMEQLECRQVPAPVTFHGGAILAHANVSSVFYGQDFWTGDPTGNIRNTMIDFMKGIVQSPYMAMLGEYGVGRGTIGTSYDPVYAGPKNGTTALESQIQNMLTSQILNGRLPWPGSQQLYFVYLTPGAQDSWDVANGDAAHHGSYLFLPGTSLQSPVYYAVIPTAHSSIATLTTYVSHELAEAVTDPDVRLSDPTGPNTGYDYTYSAWRRDSGSAEIGDGLESQTAGFLIGNYIYTVQKEWSNYFGEGIVANGSKAGMLDVPTWSPYCYEYFDYIASNSWNNGGRTISYDYAWSYDGAMYVNFTTDAGDNSGWFTLA
jgi:hypothetical protein